MQPLDDRGSTADWLIPEDREALEPPGPGLEERLDDALSVAREALRLAQDARKAAGRAEAASPGRLADLAARVEEALSRLEAREMAIERRLAEAKREQLTVRSFDERADRIVRRLRDLERLPVAFRVARPAPGDPAAAR
ncbi:MAG: hypothetical protein U0R52_08300 [Solirubrobacterales bacterium]